MNAESHAQAKPQPKCLVADIDGYRWELVLAGELVEMRRSRFQIDPADEEPSLDQVAAGVWDGERIIIRKLGRVRGDGLRLQTALPLLSDMVRMAIQGG